MSKNIETKVLIIGSGPAGYTAAIYAARANLKPVLVQGMEPGGQLMITTDVENFPGFADIIQGPWLMEQMRAQAEHVGTQMIQDMIVDVDFSKRPFTCKGDSGTTYMADTVIICTGAKARWLGLEGETIFRGLGVSACATCDGFFFRGKEVAVVGGGNSAVEEALFLTSFATKVTLIHRRDTLRAEKIAQDRLFAHPKVEIIWDHAVEEILGNPQGTDNPGVTGLRLKSTKTGQTQDIKVDGVFMAIGHDPATDLFKGKLKMDESGYILTAPDSTATSVKGVYAAGDVKDKIYRQAVTAAGTGCMAALEADRFLLASETPQQQSHAAE
ncbi:MAG: thioredoxin-disulfide reductase [Micavibrio aeruginosavorus]|uniref:Thioredoxin reductase n=1 Tax=Micavibrio aeruginosavorus TaxID=349221 RepID=A0A2W5HRP5_9BACT|nr:MAG: thioredoxin-disulfide reductase [Micavibrio aeruginosavorus]